MVVKVGRRRRKIVKKKVVKPPPKIFLCPVCNVEAVTVLHQKGDEHAEVVCTNCKTKVKVKWCPAYSEVDAYSEFYDTVTGRKKLEVVAETQSTRQEDLQGTNENSVDSGSVDVEQLGKSDEDGRTDEI